MKRDNFMRKNIVLLLTILCSMFFVCTSCTTKEKEVETPKEYSYDIIINEYIEELDLKEEKDVIIQDDMIKALITTKVNDNEIPRIKDVDPNISVKEANELLHQERMMIAEYFRKVNGEICDKLNLFEYKCVISEYSPHIEVLFESLDKYKEQKEDFLNRINKKEYVESVNITRNVIQTSVLGSVDYDGEISFQDVLPLVGVSNDDEYTGDGVNVGIIDQLLTNSTVNLKEGLYTLHPNSLGDYNYYDHAFQVASVIGGKTGIAADAHIHFAMRQNNSLVEIFNNLLTIQDVSVICIPLSFYGNGHYDNYCAYFDYVAKIGHVIFCNSAGNRGDYFEHEANRKTIVSPALGMNVLAIGSVDSDLHVSSFSSRVSLDDFLTKPDFVAPGRNIIGIPNIEDPLSGTSFSAPIVTGIVAKLIEEFPYYIWNPAILKSALRAGCTKLPEQTTYHDSYGGYGLINYKNAKEILEAKHYGTITVRSSYVPNTVFRVYDYTIPSGYTFRMCMDLTANAEEYVCYLNNQPVQPIFSKLKFQIMNEDQTSILALSTSRSNLYTISYSNNTNSPMNIKLTVSLLEKVALNEEVMGFVYTYYPSSHSHFLSNYEQLDDNYHICTCECGYSEISEHFMKNRNGQYMCLKCGYIGDSPFIH